MRTHAGGGSPAPLLWALIALFGLPAFAEAQLFPNMNIKRKRVPCAEEAPVYKMYREQYYGYYPTCWRRFPPGWGCPSPEAPPPWDFVQREAPIRSERDMDIPSVDTPLPDVGGDLGGNNLPLPADTGSPFEMPGDAAPAPGTPPGILPPPGLNAPAPPPADGSLFDRVPGPSSMAPGLPPGGLNLPAASLPEAEDPLSSFVAEPPVNSLVAATGPMGPEMVEAPMGGLPFEMDEHVQPHQAPRRGVVAGMLDRVGLRRR